MFALPCVVELTSQSQLMSTIIQNSELLVFFKGVNKHPHRTNQGCQFRSFEKTSEKTSTEQWRGTGGY